MLEITISRSESSTLR